MLFMSDVDLVCINDAAYEYQVPAKLIIAVLNVERGKVGMAIRNANGTYDLGPMQINSSWKKTLSKSGFSLQQVRDDACTNIKVGTWILSKNIANNQNLFRGIGDYNSKTWEFNTRYTKEIRIRYTELSQFLSQ
jgi:soluble lytic murein transglycosylase-like protein